MLGETIGIDFGSAMTRIYLKGQGIVLAEPTIAAIDDEGKIICAGDEAAEMTGRTPKNIYAVRPIKNGVVSDFRIAEKILKYFIKKACGSRLFKPSAVISVPGEISQVSEKAIIDVARCAGVKNASLADAPLASAMGAGADIILPRGNFILDIGAEVTNAAVLSMGGIVLNSMSKTAGASFDRAICDYVKREKKIIIGERAACEIKMNIGTLEDEEKSCFSRGRCLLSGLPKHFEITSGEIKPYLKEVAEEIIKDVIKLLEKTPPQLISDISEEHIILSGGSAGLAGFAKEVEIATQIKCIIADDSENCTVKGLGRLIDEEDTIYNKAL